MKTVDTHGSFDEALSGSSDPMHLIAGRLRDLIVEVYPDVVEVPWPKQKIIGYGVGPKKMSEHFCYIGAFRQHVNLGFYYGAHLPDPGGLLEGTVRICAISRSARLKKLPKLPSTIFFKPH